MEEIFDIFDEHNKLIGQQLRRIVHKRGLYHRSVNVLLFNEKAEILLQRRAETKDVCPGLWDLSCAEHLQPGEDYESAARRGLKEELGIQLSQLKNQTLLQMREPKLFVHQHWKDPILRHTHEADVTDREFSSCFIAKYDSFIDPPFILQQEELSEVKFVPLKDAFALCAEGKTTPWMTWEFDNYRKWDSQDRREN
eukprot:TRINITY_DN8403_c0_g1_i1.p1 TRINITY_DN8403_c0_g1~~TRINITY_DN8403_c0_g1_i1.p1  ORF type:complete len:196 (-),score=56.90 TRINITY_DN8403_c0_g1_i1:108-695(-)